MSDVLRLKRSRVSPLGVREGVVLRSVSRRGGAAALLDFGKDGTVAASCLRCPDQPCISYGSSDVGIDLLPSFPSDPSTDVCPTGAIEWPDDAEAPSVNAAACISCGVCAARCPVGAVFLGGDGAASVSTSKNPLLVPERSGQVGRHETTRAMLGGVVYSGELRTINEGNLLAAQERVNHLGPGAGAKFPTLLTRNLLRALGVRTEARRLGDVNVRMDLAFGTASQVGTAEVEFSASTLLDAPRNILDNLSVLIARYGVPRQSVRGLIVGLSLPNERSEFWQVLADIRKVLGVEVSVATVPALYMLVWSGRRLDEHGLSELAGTAEERSIRHGVEAILGQRVPISRGSGGVLESTK